MANKDTTKEFVHVFTSETEGAEPASLTKVGTNNIYEVEDARSWYGQVLEMRGGGSIEHNWAYFDTNRSDGDGYFFAVVNFDDFAGDRAGIVFRAHDDSGTERAYAAMLYNGTGLRLSRFAGTSETTIATTSGETWAVDTWYALKVYASGSTIKVKAWDIDNEAEPSSWAIDTTDANIDNTNTGVGVYGRIGNGNPVYIDHLQSLKYDALPHATPATLEEERENVWTSMKDRFLRWDGAVIKDRAGGGLHSVSEGSGYFMLEAVNQNDQTAFDLLSDFVQDNLIGSLNAEDWDSLVAWDFDISGGNVVNDWNYASDGDNDILYAYLAAHVKWGSAGTVNYKAIADAMEADLYTYTINVQGTLKLQVPYPSELTDTTAEINPSYFRPALFAVLHSYYPATGWDDVLADGWTMINAITDNAGTLATTAGLIPDWANYNTSTNTFGDPVQGTHTTEHGFEAPRVYPFFEMAADVYSSTEADTYLKGNIATFLNQEYTDHSKIKAVFNHDGTDATGNDYDLSYFNYGYVFPLERAGSSNASAFRTAKVDNQYTENSTDAEIAYFGSNGYYGGSLNMINASVDDGVFTDIQQVVGSIVSVKVGGAFGSITPQIKVGGTFVDKPTLVKVGGTFI